MVTEKGTSTLFHPELNKGESGQTLALISVLFSRSTNRRKKFITWGLGKESKGAQGALKMSGRLWNNEVFQKKTAINKKQYHLNMDEPDGIAFCFCYKLTTTGEEFLKMTNGQAINGVPPTK